MDMYQKKKKKTRNKKQLKSKRNTKSNKYKLVKNDLYKLSFKPLLYKAFN